jgi:hypothetical protein
MEMLLAMGYGRPEEREPELGGDCFGARLVGRDVRRRPGESCWQRQRHQHVGNGALFSDLRFFFSKPLTFLVDGNKTTKVFQTEESQSNMMMHKSN